MKKCKTGNVTARGGIGAQAGVRRRAARLAAMAAVAGTLAGCGGNDNEDDSADSELSFTAPLVVSNGAAACVALKGKTIDAALIGEPTSGAVVSAATYKAAVADAPNAANTAIVQATPDYCEVLVDIKPVDPAAPLIKSQVNLPTSWNGKKLGGLKNQLQHQG